MTLPPERISIKRRRQEEPVETLYLDHNSSDGKKRRFTDYFFQRLRDDATVLTSHPRTSLPSAQDSTVSKSVAGHSGIPSVRATAPGDEIKDFLKLRAAQKARQEGENPASGEDNERIEKPDSLRGALSTSSSPGRAKSALARRFHLSHDLSSSLAPKSSSPIRRQKATIRPPLATFVERHGATFDEKNSSFHKQTPVDKILSHTQTTQAAPQHDDANHVDLEAVQSSARVATTTFSKPQVPKTLRGQSINDHPSTWDRDSDQLADELAALAMELDPDPKATSQTSDAAVRNSTSDEVHDIIMDDDGYVYETYIRMRADDQTAYPRAGLVPEEHLGVLIIEEQDEDLWHRYAESDEESDWDEEDSNAEDNPANDYPEDEVSSDDEYGHNIYQHRQHGSDDEQYDDDDADW